MEQAKDTFRPAFGGWLWGTAAGLGTIVLGLAGIGLTVGAAGDWGGWPLVLTGIAVAIALGRWLAVMSSLYELTAERLILRRGIFLKSIDEVELYRIKDVRMNFSLLNQLAGIGTICITSSDETTRNRELNLRFIPRAKQRREMLRALVDAARRRRGVREVDMFTDPL
jgi:uncharacterized membrane protein YdbT with pleckstrin-like domain